MCNPVPWTKLFILSLLIVINYAEDGNSIDRPRNGLSRGQLGAGIGRVVHGGSSGVNMKEMLRNLAKNASVANGRIYMYDRNYYYGQHYYPGAPNDHHTCKYDITNSTYFKVTDINVLNFTATAFIIYSCQMDYACCGVDCCHVSIAIWIWIVAALLAMAVLALCIYGLYNYDFSKRAKIMLVSNFRRNINPNRVRAIKTEAVNPDSEMHSAVHAVKILPPNKIE